MATVSIANQLFSILTVAGQAAIVILLAVLIADKKRVFLAFIGRNAILFAFVIALFVTMGSLFYSEIAGYEPCKLCWFQRVLMYPQTIILGMALWKKDKGIADYSLALSLLGAVVAGYHYLLQAGVAPNISCLAAGSISCAQRFVMNLGYITIPMMAFTAFAMIALLMLCYKRSRNVNININDSGF